MKRQPCSMMSKYEYKEHFSILRATDVSWIRSNYQKLVFVIKRNSNHKQKK